MRVLIVDQDREGALGWHCGRTLARLSHEVSIFDLERRPGDEEPGRQRLRSLVARRLPFLARRVVARRNEGLVARVRSFKPDLVLFIKGRLVLPSTLEALRRMRERPLLANWYPDPELPLDDWDVLASLQSRLPRIFHRGGVVECIA